MDIPFSVPASIVPLFVGLIFMALGIALVGSSSLLARLLGIVVAIGGMSVLLTPVPNTWMSAGVKFILVILLFIGLSAQLARSGWKTSQGAVLTGIVLVLLGILALIVQVNSFFAVPTGALQQVIESGFRALSGIFNLAGTQLD